MAEDALTYKGDGNLHSLPKIALRDTLGVKNR